VILGLCPYLSTTSVSISPLLSGAMTSPTRHPGRDKRRADALPDAPPRSKKPWAGDEEEIEDFSDSGSREVLQTRTDSSMRSFTTFPKQKATKSSSNTGRNRSQTSSAALGAHIVSIDYKFVHSRTFTSVPPSGMPSPQLYRRTFLNPYPATSQFGGGSRSSMCLAAHTLTKTALTLL
jgi:hypothetical protein